MSTLLTLQKQHSSLLEQPSTIRGIKKKAKAIRQPGQKHATALDFVAKAAGYRNFHHAQRELSPASPQHRPPPGQHSIFISAYWRDRDSSPRSAGCETIQIHLSRPVKDLMTRHQGTYARNLEGFRLEAPDNLEMRANTDSQARARELLVRAALSIQFMEVTGLRPATSERNFKALENLEGFPSKDHVSLWIDPNSGGWIALDEPYGHVNEKSLVSKRAEWITDHALHLHKPTWGGLYFPGNAVPHLISSDGELLHRVASSVEALDPIAAVPSDTQPWDGTSASYTSQFVSPAREASGVARKPRPGTTYGYSKGAIEYHREAGYASLWRPETQMSLEDHSKIGSEFQRLCISPMTFNAHKIFRSWCSTLENWMYAEYQKSERDDKFYDTYYGGNPAPYETVEDQQSAIDRVCKIVLAGYIDCKPRRDLLKDLKSAQAIIAKVLPR